MSDDDDARDAGGRLRAHLGAPATAAAQVGTFACDIVHRRIEVDTRLLALLGLDDDFDGSTDTLRLRVHPQDRPLLAETFRRTVASGADFEVEVRVVVADAGTRWLLLRGHLVRAAASDAVRDSSTPLIVGTGFDVTARREGDAQTVRMFETKPTAFFSLDGRWRFTYINAAAEALLGRSRGALLGGTIWDLFPETLGSSFETNYRGAVRSGLPLTFEACYPAPLDATYEVQAWPNEDSLAVYFQDITERRRMEAVAERDARRDALLAEVGSQLAGTMEPDEALDRIADVLVPAVADWCLVTLVDEAHPGAPVHLQDVGSTHADPAARPLVARYAKLRLDSHNDSSAIFEVLASGELVHADEGATEALLANLVDEEARALVTELAPQSGAAVALRGRGRPTGLITLYNGADRGPITADDLLVVREVAARAGLALDNMRLYGQQRKVAEGLQRSLLTAPAEPDHLEIAVRYVPATESAEVGGDWYDAFLQRSGEAVLVIGDVVGHDIAAAAAMGEIRSVMRGIAVTTGSGPAGLLSEVDHALRTLGSTTMATAVVARIEQTEEQRTRSERTVRWSNAGHPPPMVVGPDGSVTRLVLTPTNLLLGVSPETDRAESSTTLAPGSTLFLYTDGLIERRDRSIRGGLVALEVALESVAERDLEDLCDQMLLRMLPPTRQDDIAIVAVRMHRQDVPRPPQAGPNRVPSNVPPDLA